LPHLPLGDSGRIRVGDWLVTVGAPKGLEGTVTAGIVTATPVAGSVDLLAGLLQTDAATGRGSSGGPLVSTDGEIVGLIVGFDADGMSYARPSNAVRKVYLELVERGHVRRAWLGIATQTLSPELARALGARDTAGILVADVSPDGPAAAAGLRSGDIVTAIDGTAIASRARLDRVVDDLAPGRTVRLSVRRAAVARVIRVTLGDEPDEWKLPPDLARARKLLGIGARALTPTMGVVAADVEPMSPAGQAGLEAGDVLREINGRLIRTLRDFQDAMRSVKTGTPVLMLVQRGDAAVYVALEPGP
jgi:serine protease Do